MMSVHAANLFQQNVMDLSRADNYLPFFDAMKVTQLINSA